MVIIPVKGGADVDDSLSSILYCLLYFEVLSSKLCVEGR